jgi:hypothetical protein
VVERRSEPNKGEPASANKQQITQEQAAYLASNPELDPFEIEFLPEFQEGRGPQAAFVNKHGVVIGDHEYESEQSPLQQWTIDTDPEVMAGDEWVHPFKDIGFHSPENKDYFEKGITPQGGIFTHADKDVAYETFSGEESESQVEPDH